MYCKRVRQITVSLALAAVAASVMFFCSPSNPYLPNERITAVITAHITGPLYQGNFYKGYLPITDFVVWIEDENSRYIKTLQVSKGAVNVASSGVHAEHLPIWAKSANVKCDLKVAKDSLAYILPEFDGLTSASLKVKLSKDTIMILDSKKSSLNAFKPFRWRAFTSSVDFISIAIRPFPIIALRFIVTVKPGIRYPIKMSINISK